MLSRNKTGPLEKEMLVLPTKHQPAFTEQILSDEIVFFIFFCLFVGVIQKLGSLNMMTRWTKEHDGHKD